MTKRKGARIGEWRDVASDNHEWVERAKRVSVRSTVTSPLVIDPYRGKLATVYDMASNAYLDFGMVGTNNFGYGTSLMTRMMACAKKLAVPLFPEHDTYNSLAILAKERLIEVTPLTGPGLVYGASSGSDANEVVLDALLRARPERRVFGRFECCFHGRNVGIRSFLDHEIGKKKWERVKNYPTPYQTIAFPFPSTSEKDPVARLKERFERIDPSWLKQMNGFFMEMVEGEGGVNVAHSEAINFLIEELRKHDIAIVVDEVQTGMGRTGTLWAYEQYDFLPDFVTLGKSLGAGAEVAAAVVIAERWNFEDFGARSSTYGIEPKRAEAILAGLDALTNQNLLAQTKEIETLLDSSLRALAERSPLIREVRGVGAMYAVEFCNSPRRDQTIENALRHGLIIHQCGYPEENPSIRVMPPLVIPKNQLQRGIDILERSLIE